jgi:hypothetical protein
LEEGAVGHDELDLHARDSPGGARSAFNQGVGHDLSTCPVIPFGAKGVGVPAERGMHGDALRDGQQGCQVGHGVRCRAKADTPLLSGATGPLGDGAGVPAVGRGPNRRGDGAVPDPGEGPCVGSEFVVDGAPVGRGQACCLLDDHGGTPFVELPAVQGGQGVRHLGHEGLGEAKQAAAAAGRFPAGEGDLRGHALAPFRDGDPGRGLLPPLGGIKGHGNPGLQAGAHALQDLQASQLLDQPGAVRAELQRTRRSNQVLNTGTGPSGAGRIGVRGGVIGKRGLGKRRARKCGVGERVLGKGGV